MSYIPLFELLPEVAEKETRSLTLLVDNPFGLPPDEYGLVELYCGDKNCDCQRVFFNVVSKNRKTTVATVSFGWESKDFYALWMSRGKIKTYDELDKDDQLAVNDLYGFRLNQLSEQSELAPKILKMVEDLLKADEDYYERILRHYKIFRAKIDRKDKRKEYRKRF
jgi:hypothetical protein